MDSIISSRAESKKNFNHFLSEINNHGIKKNLNKNQIKHLNHLTKMWRDDKLLSNPRTFFKMKDHHSHINGEIKSKKLLNLWDDYIKSVMQLRISIKMLYYFSNKDN